MIQGDKREVELTRTWIGQGEAVVVLLSPPKGIAVMDILRVRLRTVTETLFEFPLLGSDPPPSNEAS